MSDGLDRKRLYPILLIIFTNILGAGVILPILPLYAEGTFGGTILQVTLLSTAYFAAQFIAAPVLGRLSDRYGRRPVLIASQMGTVVAFILFIFASQLGQLVQTAIPALPISGGMFMLYVARIVDGITGGNITTAQAYVSDITDDQDRAQGLGYLQAAFGAGFIFGPAFGGILANWGPVMPFIGAAIITAGTLILTTLTLEESLPAAERSEGPVVPERVRLPLDTLTSQPALLLVLGIGFFSTLAFSSVPPTFALFADHVLFGDAFSPQRVQLFIGLMLAFNGSVAVLTQIVALKPLVSRVGERMTILVGNLALMAAFFSLSFTRSPILATAILAPWAFGRGVSEPTLQALVTRFGGEDTRGQLLGIYQSARSLALIFGPVWAGYAFEQISPSAVYVVAGFVMLVALLLILLLIRQELPAMRPRHAEAAASPD